MYGESERSGGEGEGEADDKIRPLLSPEGKRHHFQLRYMAMNGVEI